MPKTARYNNNNNNAICVTQIRRKQQMGCSHCPKRKAFSLALNVSICLISRNRDEQGLATIFQATVVSRVLYALPAWFGQLTQLDTGRINGLFRKAHRWQLSGHVYTVEQLAGMADAGLLKTIISNPNHSLYQILPPLRPNQYSLCKRGHPFQLPIINTTLLKSIFINRCLFQFA